jgi:hypothetical protein
MVNKWIKPSWTLNDGQPKGLRLTPIQCVVMASTITRQKTYDFLSIIGLFYLANEKFFRHRLRLLASAVGIAEYKRMHLPRAIKHDVPHRLLAVVP